MVKWHCQNKQGFTLIEVLLALAIIAIALTALISTNAFNLKGMARLQEKTRYHWVQMQGVAMIQTGMLTKFQDNTQITSLLGQRIYWRVKTESTPIHGVQRLNITASARATGPFQDTLIAYRYSE